MISFFERKYTFAGNSSYEEKQRNTGYAVFSGTEFIMKIKNFIKKEIVLCVATVLAVISALFILPDGQYVDYIDFRTLGILLCLMCVMAGLQGLGVFRLIARQLLTRVKTLRGIVTILVLLCFFFSMVITNDVALITFVPFTVTVLGMLDGQIRTSQLIPVVVLQTIAANLGSMLTPIGNPQNLYLYGKAGLGMGEFLLLMLPYTMVSLLIILLLTCCRKGLGQQLELNFEGGMQLEGKAWKLAVYLLLFIICLLAVAHILPYQVMLVIVLPVVAVMDHPVLKRVDYSLLLTFIAFFIFIGNMGRIPAFREFLQNIIQGNEVYTAVLSSQVISNVPAALLLSEFTTDYPALIVGVNLGGLGTLIASMASLISYKYIAADGDCNKGKYFCTFTIANICILILLVLVYIVVA